MKNIFNFKSGTVMTINKFQAAKWLGFNRINRPVRINQVKKYARDMEDGNWVFNAQSILFDRDNNLIDGQHRLLAVVESALSIKAPVFYGLDAEVIKTLDCGVSRCFSDNLRIDGEKNYNSLAAAVRFLSTFLDEKTFNSSCGRTVSINELYAVMARNMKIREGVANMASRHTALRIFGSLSLFSAIHYHFSKKDKDTADSFFEYFSSGDGLASNSPIFVLREKLIRDKLGNPGTKKIPSGYVAALVIKAWNLLRAGKSCKILRFNPTKEEYPRIK